MEKIEEFSVRPPTPSSLIDYIAWFQEKLDSLPPGSRIGATVDIDAGSTRDATRVMVRWPRPETPEEEATRSKREGYRADRLRRAELAALAMLTAKYGTPKP